METTSNGIRYKKSDSLSTDSTYYKFFDDKGRTATVRTSDHDASWFREPADFDLPIKTPLEQIIRMGESALLGKEIKIPVFLEDEIAGNTIQRLSSGKYGMSVTFKNGMIVPLHQFEDMYGVKVKDRTREQEKQKLIYRSLLNQLEEKGLFIHSGKLDKFKTENYPALISSLYHVKDAIPYSEKDNLDKYKKYSKEQFYTWYISKEEDGKKEHDYVDFYKPTAALVPYLNYLIKEGVLQKPNEAEIEAQLPKPFVEAEDDKAIRLKGEEITRLEKAINAKTNGMLKQHGLEHLEKNYSERFDIPEIKRMLAEKEQLQKEYSELVKAKNEKQNQMETGGVVENYRLNKSIFCEHKPTLKGAKCTRKTLNSVGKCWQHI